jgi:hypothetical protein
VRNRKQIADAEIAILCPQLSLVGSHTWHCLAMKFDSSAYQGTREKGSNMNPARFLHAIFFVADKHKDQRRKDAEAQPYINDPIAVATVLRTDDELSDEATLLAAGYPTQWRTAKLISTN